MCQTITLREQLKNSLKVEWRWKQLPMRPTVQEDSGLPKQQFLFQTRTEKNCHNLWMNWKSVMKCRMFTPTRSNLSFYFLVYNLLQYTVVNYHQYTGGNYIYHILMMYSYIEYLLVPEYTILLV